MFGTIDIKPRPIRLAFLVDPNNAAQTREAIRLSSSLWGGAYFPILPLYTRMPASWQDPPLRPPKAKEVTLGYLDAFDPDVLVQLSGTVPDYVIARGLRIIKSAEIWQPLTRSRGYAPAYGIGIFDLLERVFDKYFKYKPKYPMRVIIPQLPRELSLFWSSVFGELPAVLEPALREGYYEPVEAETPLFQIEKLEELIKPDVLYPRRIIEMSLDIRGPSRHRDAYVYYMDAKRTEDVVDFWNLRAIGKRVLPVPSQLADQPPFKNLVANFLKENRRHWPHNPKVCDTATILRARNVTREQLQEYVKTIDLKPPADDTSDDGYFAIANSYPRVWDEWARDKDFAIPASIYGTPSDAVDLNDPPELKFRFRPVRPSVARDRIYLTEPTFANELSFSFYGSPEYLGEVFPRSAGDYLQRAIGGLGSLKGEWRIGANGLVKLVSTEFTEVRDIPLAESVMFAWLADLGWTPTLSAPGLLAKRVFRRLRGFPGLLRNESLLGLLEHMNGGAVQLDGRPVDEKHVAIRQERDLLVGVVKNRLKAEGDLYELLIERGIFNLGLQIGCPRCLRHSWFNLPSLHDQVVCPRCLELFPAIGNVDQSNWSLKTTGPFSVAQYADGAFAVLLALEFFVGRSRSLTMRVTAVPSFEADGHGGKLEADFALLWQESIYGERKDGVLFGECKTYSTFTKRDFDRARYLAKMFPGAILAFCTLRKQLTTSEIAGIVRIAKAGRKYWKAERPINPILVLTGTELFSFMEPPYCWEGSTRQKFERVVGLLGLSNATQQIYLGLTSWESEWQAKWERRRRRRQDRERRVGIAPDAKPD